MTPAEATHESAPSEFVLYEEYLGVYLAMRPGDGGWLIETRKTPDGEAVASFKRPLVHVLEWLTSEKAAWALSSHRDKLEAVRAAAKELLRSLPPGSFIGAEEVGAIELAADRMQVLRRDLDEVVDHEGRARRRRRVEEMVASGEIGATPSSRTKSASRASRDGATAGRCSAISSRRGGGCAAPSSQSRSAKHSS